MGQDRTKTSVPMPPPAPNPRMGWAGDEVVPSQCGLCLNRNTSRKYPGAYCRAFPGGIPREFMLNEVDHREPVDYDGGTRFERDPNTDLGAYIRLDAYWHNRGKTAE